MCNRPLSVPFILIKKERDDNVDYCCQFIDHSSPPLIIGYCVCLDPDRRDCSIMFWQFLLPPTQSSAVTQPYYWILARILSWLSDEDCVGNKKFKPLIHSHNFQMIFIRSSLSSPWPTLISSFHTRGTEIAKSLPDFWPSVLTMYWSSAWVTRL